MKMFKTILIAIFKAIIESIKTIIGIIALITAVALCWSVIAPIICIMIAIAMLT